MAMFYVECNRNLKAGSSLIIPFIFFFQLLGAANFFLLEGLQRYCEQLCARRLNFDNCMSIYKHARVSQSLIFDTIIIFVN